MPRLARALGALLAASAAVPALAGAQTRVFSTATTAEAAPAVRCGGSPFLFCASAFADYTAATGLLTLTVTNASPAAGSVFGEIGLGGLSGYTLASANESGAGTFDLLATGKLNGYNGVGLDNNLPGLVGQKSGSISNGLQDGQTAVFNFFLRSGSAAPTLAAVRADLLDARLVLHDQGGGLAGCAGSAKMSVGNYLAPGATTSADVTCGPTAVPPVGSVVPEPSAVALTGAGLFGLVGAARRRRRA